MPRAEGRLGAAGAAGLLERSTRASPGHVDERSHGCVLRHTPGAATWWEQAALLHGGDVDEMIARAERFAAAHNSPVHVHVCPGCPEGLDSALAVRGYRRHTRVAVMTGRPASLHDDRPVGRSVLSPTPAPAWFDAQTRQVIARVDLQSSYAAVVDGPHVVSVGRAVLDDGWVGIFSMYTQPAARRRGHARAVLAALLSWASERCDAVYLQVRLVDTPARHLYASLGFTDAATYHYRSADSAP